MRCPTAWNTAIFYKRISIKSLISTVQVNMWTTTKMITIYANHGKCFSSNILEIHLQNNNILGKSWSLSYCTSIVITNFGQTVKSGKQGLYKFTKICLVHRYSVPLKNFFKQSSCIKIIGMLSVIFQVFVIHVTLLDTESFHVLFVEVLYPFYIWN